MKRTPQNLKQVFTALKAAGLDAVVVGGQAVNLWAVKYSNRLAELKQYVPFASEDIDFFGGRLEAVICHEVLGGTIRLNQDFDPSPNAGVVLVEFEDGKLRIDFLSSVYGLNDREISDTAITFSGAGELSGLELKVLNPVLCLEGKLKSLNGLPQEGRQDKKHLEMSLLCVREMLVDICERESPRTGLKLIERVFGNAITEDGLKAWSNYGINIESAVPVGKIIALDEPQWQKFNQIRLPQLLLQLEEKRERYAKMIERLAQRREELKVKRQAEISEKERSPVEENKQTNPENDLEP